MPSSRIPQGISTPSFSDFFTSVIETRHVILRAVFLCWMMDFKLGFVVQGFHPCTPPKNFLKKVLWNLKNFQKALINNLFKILGILKPFF